MLAGSDTLAGGCSPRVERGGQEALTEILDHPGSKDAEKLMETVVKASTSHCPIRHDELNACHCIVSSARVSMPLDRCLAHTCRVCPTYSCLSQSICHLSAYGQSTVIPGAHRGWERP